MTGFASLLLPESSVTAYWGLRGLALQDEPEAADLGLAVVRWLHPEEVRAFNAAGPTWGERGNDLCAARVLDVTWSITAEPLSQPDQREAPLVSDLLAVTLLLTESRDPQHHLRAPHTVWDLSMSEVVCTG